MLYFPAPFIVHKIVITEELGVFKKYLWPCQLPYLCNSLSIFFPFVFLTVMWVLYVSHIHTEGSTNYKWILTKWTSPCNQLPDQEIELASAPEATLPRAPFQSLALQGSLLSWLLTALVSFACFWTLDKTNHKFYVRLYLTSFVQHYICGFYWLYFIWRLFHAYILFVYSTVDSHLGPCHFHSSPQIFRGSEEECGFPKCWYPKQYIFRARVFVTYFLYSPPHLVHCIFPIMFTCSTTYHFIPASSFMN